MSRLNLSPDEQESLVTLARYYRDLLNMSDPEHEDFADSCADVVEQLWSVEPVARRLIDRLDRCGETRPIAQLIGGAA